MGARDAIRMRAIRRQMGWSRKELARLLGVSVACIGRMERGEEDPTEDMASRMTAAVGDRQDEKLSS